MELYETGTGQFLKVHDKGKCGGEHCPIHNPSDHVLKDRPTHWRDDRGIMERICEHGVGHPDPDDNRVRSDPYESIHGCDGCCVEVTPEMIKDAEQGIRDAEHASQDALRAVADAQRARNNLVARYQEQQERKNNG